MPLGALLLALAAAASVPASVAVGPSIAALSSWLAWLVLFGLVRHVARTADGRRRVLTAIALGALWVGGESLREYASAVREFQGSTIWRTFGTFANPNLLASFLAMTIPLVLSRALAEERRPWAIGFGAIVLLQLATLPITGSRGGLAVLVGGLGVMALLALVRREWPDRRALTRLGIILALGVPLFLLLSGQLVNRLLAPPRPAASGAAAAAPNDPQAQSNQFRRLTWESTARMAMAHPAPGTGIGTFKYIHPRYAIAGFTEMAHQSYLQLAAETGVAGLLGLLLLLLGAAVGVVRAPPGTGSERWLAAGLGGGIAAAAAHNLVDYSWYVYGTAAVFWVMMGMVGGMTPPPSPLPETERGSRSVGTGSSPLSVSGRGVGGRDQAVRTLAIALIAVLLLGNLLLESAAARMAAGDAILAEAREKGTFDPSSADAAIEAYRSAATLFPLDPAPHLALGDLLLARGDGSGALAEFRAVVRWAPTRSVHYYRLGRALVKLGQPREAVTVFEKGLAWDPHSNELLWELAETQQALKNEPASHDAYRRILAIAASPAGTVNALQGMRDWRPARAHEMLGDRADAAGRRSEAVKEWEQAATLLRQRRTEMRAAGMVAAQRAAGNWRIELERGLWEREVQLWDRLTRQYRASGQPARAEEAAKHAADARAQPPEA
jgi:O-antigen ligase/tetratricopeptide (TPR) repeat protein